MEAHWLILGVSDLHWNEDVLILRVMEEEGLCLVMEVEVEMEVEDFVLVLVEVLLEVLNFDIRFYC